MKQNQLPEDWSRRDHSHIEMAYLTYFYFDQENTQSLTDLLREYATYPKDILDRVQFVVVDDGSPLKAVIPPDINLNILFLRIDTDIPWNISGAKNLGVVMARADKVFSTDLDHKIPEQTFRRMMEMKNPGRAYYKLFRKDEDGTELGYPSNIVFFSRGRYLRYHGTDEQFAGRYGSEDIMFWRWQRYFGARFKYFARRYFCIRRSSIDLETSYHSLPRDGTQNSELATKIKADWKLYGAATGHSRQFLSFPWHVVEDRARKTQLPPLKVNRTWVRAWWWRWLFG